MASAQVLPNTAASTRKQEHLEAGKRRLEEFRKKKAADRAKKAAPASHLHSANVDHQHDKQPLDNQHVRLTDSDGAGPSDGVSETVVEPFKEVTDDGNKENMFMPINDVGSNDKYAKPPLSTNYYSAFPAEIVQAPPKDQEFDRYNNVKYMPHSTGKSDDFSISVGALGRHAYGIANSSDQSVGFGSQVIRESNHDYSQTSHYGLEEAHSASSDAFASVLSSVNSGGFPLQNKSEQTSGLISSIYEDSVGPPTKNTVSSFGVGKNSHAAAASNDTLTFDIEERKLGNSIGHFPSGNSPPLWPSESPPTPFSFGAASSYNNVPSYPDVSEPTSRRSRPSFLDSINMPRVPPTEPGRVGLFRPEVDDMDVVTSSSSPTLYAEAETAQSFSKLRASVTGAFEHSMTSSVSAGNRDDFFSHTVHETSMDRKHNSYSRQQDDDFAALEQHIEDLTQEKFSLQRALEASRALSDSLAAENSALTDSYNQQGSVVSNLKSDMEMLQEEIKAQLVELESLKMEYGNAQLECNAADERAKLLASEVIGLEEKALRLRSSELKLERQLENSEAEISSLKRRMSSIEKERQDLQSTINALLEEKKLLQSKLRKASSNGKSVGVSKSPANRTDASTSTEDLVNEDEMDTAAERSNVEMDSTAPLFRSDASGSFLLPDSGQFDLQVSHLNIPPDQTRTIHNITTLISELALEKEELVKALLAESSESSKLKDLNTELSRKLEAQTQRLELLTAQNMANTNVPTRLPDPRSLDDNAPFADEGDEVVERVLGWIMKLFPGGPSKRRTSKLL